MAISGSIQVCYVAANIHGAMGCDQYAAADVHEAMGCYQKSFIILVVWGNTSSRLGPYPTAACPEFHVS